MLSNEQIEFFETNGYLKVSGVFSREEAQKFKAEAEAVMERLSQTQDVEQTWGRAQKIMDMEMEKAGKAKRKGHLLGAMDVQFQSALFSRLMVNERFTECAAQLMGTENIMLHHNKLFIKSAERGSPFPMHQDCKYFPYKNHSLVTAIIHFDDTPKEKGCLHFVPGSHKNGPLLHNKEGSWHLDIPIEEGIAVEAEAGDVIYFSYLTIHGSGLNSTAENRATMIVEMVDPLDEPKFEGQHQSPGQGMMLRGFHPIGAPAVPQWFSRDL